MSFPLYDIFERKAREDQSELTVDQKKKFVETVKILDQKGLDNLYLILKYSAHLSGDDKIYNPKYNRRGVVFNLEDLPALLQKIVYLFAMKHIEETKATEPSAEIIFE